MAANFWNLNSDKSSSSSEWVIKGMMSFSKGCDGKSLKTEVSRPESRIWK